MSSKARYTVLFWMTTVLLPVVIFVVQQAGAFSFIEFPLQDRLLDTRAASQEVIIVAIDDRSIQEIGVWPWSRDVHARIVDALSAGGVSAIGYDVTFSEAGDVGADAAFAQALSQAGNVVLSAEADIELVGADVTATDPLWPSEQFLRSAAGVGFTTIVPHRDGIVRLVPPQILLAGERYSTLSFAVYELLPAMPQFNAQLQGGLMRIPYVGPPGSFEQVSAVDVLNGMVPEAFLRDRVAFVGATAPNLHDAHLTPTSRGTEMPGVEIQANIFQAYLDGMSLRTLQGWQLFLLYVVLAGILGVFGTLLRWRYLVLVNTAVLVLYLISALVLSTGGLLMPMVYPVLLIVGMTLTDVLYRYVREVRDRKFVQRAFGQYMAPQIIEKIVDGDSPLELGGTKQQLSIFFSDIRSFTSISEKLAPEELVRLLNEYLDEMTEEVLVSEGVVDKYIGDAIMAFWGAPVRQEDHALRAVRSALAMKAKLAGIRKRWQAAGADLHIGIGINSGEVIVGNIGSKKRFDYTLIGDEVNLAARLEGLTKQYGVMILISESTKRQIGDGFETRLLDRVAVKGRSKPVRIYELMGFAGDLTAKQQELAQLFGAALEKYFSADFSFAKEEFEVLAATYGDATSAMFIQRCTELIEKDPGSDWDGVYRATKK